MKLESVSLKRSDHLNEKWVQAQIAEDPSILGLGDLVLKDKERIQPNAGRLDLLLQHPESLKRFEVEIQLGATDESHIVRTIEYWDIERRRYPQYEHAAVIVAEEITARFLNVIHLFNGAIPLIALKITAYKVGDQYALAFVKVLDEVTYGLVDEDEPIAEPTDRAFWESTRGTKKTLAATDGLLKIVTEVEPKATPKYNKYYIGLEVDGSPLNFVTFMPRRAHVIMTIKLPQTKEVDEQLEEVGLETLSYESQWRGYRLRIESNVDDAQSFGDKPPFRGFSDWRVCLDGRLHLILGATLPSPHSYVQWLCENLSTRHSIPYVPRSSAYQCQNARRPYTCGRAPDQS